MDILLTVIVVVMLLAEGAGAVFLAALSFNGPQGETVQLAVKRFAGLAAVALAAAVAVGYFSPNLNVVGLLAFILFFVAGVIMYRRALRN